MSEYNNLLKPNVNNSYKMFFQAIESKWSLKMSITITLEILTWNMKQNLIKTLKSSSFFQGLFILKILGTLKKHQYKHYILLSRHEYWNYNKKNNIPLKLKWMNKKYNKNKFMLTSIEKNCWTRDSLIKETKWKWNEH